ncbi:MAG: hypothetical protein HYZ71_13595 [Deltaproteobacteria bacterium]|nr:hypothetical protein [Deltaproteobacteria bacterium]
MRFALSRNDADGGLQQANLFIDALYVRLNTLLAGDNSCEAVENDTILVALLLHKRGHTMNFTGEALNFGFYPRKSSVHPFAERSNVRFELTSDLFDQPNRCWGGRTSDVSLFHQALIATNVSQIKGKCVMKYGSRLWTRKWEFRTASKLINSASGRNRSAATASRHARFQEMND